MLPGNFTEIQRVQVIVLKRNILETLSCNISEEENCKPTATIICQKFRLKTTMLGN